MGLCFPTCWATLLSGRTKSLIDCWFLRIILEFLTKHTVNFFKISWEKGISKKKFGFKTPFTTFTWRALNYFCVCGKSSGVCWLTLWPQLPASCLLRASPFTLLSSLCPSGLLKHCPGCPSGETKHARERKGNSSLMWSEDNNNNNAWKVYLPGRILPWCVSSHSGDQQVPGNTPQSRCSIHSEMWYCKCVGKCMIHVKLSIYIYMHVWMF